jgi:hypothetical protein
LLLLAVNIGPNKSACRFGAGWFSLLAGEAGLDVHLDILTESWPVIRGGYFHVGFQVCVVAAEDAVVSFAKVFFLIFPR